MPPLVLANIPTDCFDLSGHPFKYLAHAGMNSVRIMHCIENLVEAALNMDKAGFEKKI
jgi:hypothetical protein